MKAGICVALGPSPLVDRRALSQAWYDALHLAHSRVSGPRRAHVPLADARFFPRGKICSPTFPSRHPWLREKLERRTGNICRVSDLPSAEKIKCERRDQLARKIIRELVERPGVTQFVIKLPQGRICIFILRNARGVHVAALCPPEIRVHVERALARARMALAC